MARRTKLDDIDRKILAYLQEKPSASQSEIARKIGISQPAVGMRIKKLIKMGILERYVGIPIHKFNLRLAMIGVKTRDPGSLMRKFERCPRLVFMAKAIGAHQLILHFVGSCDRTLQNLIEERLSTDSNVLDFDVSLADTPDSVTLMPIKIPSEHQEKAPCGAYCSKCQKYLSGRCLGCPASIHRREVKPYDDDMVRLFLA